MINEESTSPKYAVQNVGGDDQARRLIIDIDPEHKL